MGIRETFGKVQKLVNHQSKEGKKMMPEEVELASFKERERMDNVKKELSKYRLRNSQEALIGTKIQTGSTILAQKMNLLKESKKKKHKNILTGMSNLW